MAAGVGGVVGVVVGGLTLWGLGVVWGKVEGGVLGVVVGLRTVVVGMVVRGAVVGTAQWLVLRRRLHRAGWWVLATALGGVGVGAIRGFVLITLLRHPRVTPPKEV